MNNEIIVNLNKKRDFYNKFSNKKINDKLSEYIYDEALEGSYKSKVIINISCNEVLSDEEKQEMIDIIRRNYGIKVKDLLYTYEIKQDRKALLLALGIVLIILYYTGFASILKDVIFLIGWISICSSLYGLIFASTESYIKIKRLKNLSTSRIYFQE